MNPTSRHSESEFAAFVGIDWGDRQHSWALQAAGSATVEQGSLDHTPEAVAQWAGELEKRFGGRPVAVVLEQSRGALLYMLTRHAHLVLYPVHAATLADYRKALHPCGGKDDPTDAALLVDFLCRHGDRLRLLPVEADDIRLLRLLVEKRRRLVDEKTRVKNRLTAELKLYYPQMLNWFEDLETRLVADWLKRWPRLDQLQRSRLETVRRFLHEHNSRQPGRIDSLLQSIWEAQSATEDQAVIESSVVMVQALVSQMQLLCQVLDDLERRIDAVAKKQEDYFIFRSFPGAGPALAPRLLVAFGSRRERFPAAQNLQCYSGIAPVTKRSGQMWVVYFRWKSPKFLRQTFQEWAHHSVQHSEWARIYYQHQRDVGKNHQSAVRSLAYKWQRIAYRCWQDGTAYDEARYLRALRKHGSPYAPAAMAAEC